MRVLRFAQNDTKSNGNSKGKNEIQGSFDSSLRAFAQDDD